MIETLAAIDTVALWVGLLAGLMVLGLMVYNHVRKARR